MFLRSRVRAMFLAPVAGAAVVTFTGGLPARAQTSVPPCTADCFVLNAVNIQGVTVYPLADLSTTYDGYLARTVGVNDRCRSRLRLPTSIDRTDTFYPAP